MTLRVRAIPFILIVLIALGLAPLAGQSKPRNGNGNRAVDPDLANARPGRDPNQAIDEEYTKKIKQYTTEAFFLSPLVDYLPASRTVPTPKAVLGDIAGAEGKAPYTREIRRRFGARRICGRSTTSSSWGRERTRGLSPACRCGARRSRIATHRRHRTSAPGRRLTTHASAWDSTA